MLAITRWISDVLDLKRLWQKSFQSRWIFSKNIVLMLLKNAWTFIQETGKRMACSKWTKTEENSSNSLKKQDFPHCFSWLSNIEHYKFLPVPVPVTSYMSFTRSNLSKETRFMIVHEFSSKNCSTTTVFSRYVTMRLFPIQSFKKTTSRKPIWLSWIDWTKIEGRTDEMVKKWTGKFFPRLD